MLHMRPLSKPRLHLLLLLLAAVLLTACGARSSGANDPDYVDAVELKLKCRELADQMLATLPNEALQGVVALPPGVFPLHFPVDAADDVRPVGGLGIALAPGGQDAPLAKFHQQGGHGGCADVHDQRVGSSPRT